MERTLLATKLFAPPVAPGLVRRPRLVQRLNGILTSKLTLISAPAGFGKTTLLCQWLGEAKPDTAWLSLEEAENDPPRFWAYFIAALRSVESGVGDASLPLLRSSQPAPIESVLTPLVNDLSSKQTDLVVVLDDYHVIQSDAVHKSVAFLLEHLPARVHLVIATRADPPLPLAHSRGRGTLLETRADDLRFTLEEATGLLVGLGIPVPSAQEMEALNAKAEGWVVGLKMAALSMQGEKSASEFISAFAGTERYVMDYLVEEVLHKQTEEIHRFLLQTSILERLGGPLCDAVMQRTNGREILLNLEKGNLFLVPLDASRQWYRYHHLFRDLLQNQLALEFGNEVKDDLHRRASRWYEGNGFHENAINQALQARDWQMVMDLVSASNPIAAFGGETTFDWLNRVPRDILLTHPQACVCYAYALGFTSRFDAQKAFLDAFESSEAYDPELAGQVALVRTHAAAHLRDPRIEQYAKDALALLPTADTGWRAITTMHLGIYYLLCGRYNEAEPLLIESCDALKDTSDGFGLSQGLASLAVVNMMRGKLHHAEGLFKRAIGMAERHPNIAAAHLYLGMIYLLWNDLKAGSTELERAIALNHPNPENVSSAYLLTCGIRLEQGDTAGAAEMLNKAEHVSITGSNAAKHWARLAAYHIALAAEQEDSESASRWVDEFAGYEGFEADIPRTALLLLLERRGQAIRKQLETDSELFRKEGLSLPLIFVRIAQAVASPKRDEALFLLAEAMASGRPEGVIRPFLGWGPPLHSLLRQAISAGIESEYARKLLTVIEAEDRRRRIRKGEAPTSTSAAGLLSEREMEVLGLVAQGLSDRQIAAKLMISLSTAKTHVHRILEKLNATSRTQAITRARELKLI